MFIIYTCTHIPHLYIQNTCAHMYVYIYIYICQYVICLLGNAYIYIYACAILRTSIYYGILICINYIYIYIYLWLKFEECDGFESNIWNFPSPD